MHRLWRKFLCQIGHHDDVIAIGAAGSVTFACQHCGIIRMMTVAGPVAIDRIDPATIHAKVEALTTKTENAG